MDPVRKAFSVVSKAIDIEAGIFEAMISTETVDRQGDIVRATGAKLDNFLKNPVVFWAHNTYEPPVARALSVEIIPGDGLKSRFQFPEWGINPDADVIRRLWAGGFLNACSIGFMPIKSKPLGDDEEDRWWGPRDFVEWELLEYSIVGVPANQDALRLALRSLSAPMPPMQKRGRVLSAANEAKLRQAADNITAVLAQLESAPEEDSAPPAQTKTEPETDPATNQSDPEAGDGTPAPVTEPEPTEPNTDPTQNDSAEEAVDEEILAALSDLFTTLTGA